MPSTCIWLLDCLWRIGHSSWDRPVVSSSCASPCRVSCCWSRPWCLSSSWSLACNQQWPGPLGLLREPLALRRGDLKALREPLRRRDYQPVRVQHRYGQLPLVLGGCLDGHLLVLSAVGSLGVRGQHLLQASERLALHPGRGHEPDCKVLVREVVWSLP